MNTFAHVAMHDALTDQEARDEARRRQRAGLKPFDSERARAAGKASAAKRRALAAVASSHPRRLTPTEWLRVYVRPAFPDEWANYFWGTLKDLEKRYAPPSGGGPQYRVMCWRLAVLATCAARLDVLSQQQEVDNEERLRIDREIRNYVAQLQKYTESEKHLVEVTTAAQQQLAEMFATVIDTVIADATTRAELFDALASAVEKGSIDSKRLLNPPVVIDGEGQEVS